MSSYSATNDDLPDFEHPLTREEQYQRAYSHAQRNSAAVQLIYPMWCLSNLEKQAKRAEEKGGVSGADALDRDLNRKIYVRQEKHNQMRLWIFSLARVAQWVRQDLSPWEKQFLNQCYRKFKKYPKIKWVTENQYQALRVIAAKFLAEQGDYHD